MKVVLAPQFDSAQAERNRRVLELLFAGNVSCDNFHLVEVHGITDAVPDTQKFFPVNMANRPQLWLPKEGDVYVEQIKQGEIDVRSRLASESFTIYLLD